MALSGFPSSSFGPDPGFDRGFKLAKTAAGGIGCWFVVSWLAGLGLAIAALAVAWHFIARVW